ncbi:MAG TPA: cation:proton antiporter [Geminicoccaceae bacterium]|nr:cation:proton antiporter [Geminicoccaceae bacterium]
MAAATVRARPPASAAGERSAIALDSVFAEVAALLALASAAGLAGVLLRQPLIVSFIAAGLLAGPGVLGLVRSVEHVELLAELGVALLLFLVGLKLDLQLVRSLGSVAVATGLGQVGFTSIVGFGICLALGLEPLTSLYVAVALTFSSTIIIVKLLSDKREIDSLHGRIALGFLIVQDLAVVVAMVVLSALGVGVGSDAPLLELARVLLSGVLMLALVAAFIRWLADPLLTALARSPELLVTFAIGWAVMLAALGDWLGFGKELGGLIGGVSLASSPYRDVIAARLASLRDFLLLFFFVALGAKLDLGVLGVQLGPAIVLSLFVLIGNPLIVMAIMGFMGYRKRTGFLAGLTVAQISEFSLIFTAMGITLGHLGAEALGLVTLVGLVTITLSTYMIVYAQRLYALLEPLLGPFERRVAHREQAEDRDERHGRHDVLLFGLGRYGTRIAEGLRRQGWSVLGVDFDPVAMRAWQRQGWPGVYGDVGDPEFPETLPLAGARWVVIAIPTRSPGLTHGDPRRAAIHAFRAAGFAAGIAVAAHGPEEIEELGAAGADLVLTPFADAADRAVELITGLSLGRSAAAAAE